MKLPRDPKEFGFEDIRVPGAPPYTVASMPVEREVKISVGEFDKLHKDVKEWRDRFFGLLILVTLAIIWRYAHPNGNAAQDSGNIGTQGWATGEWYDR